MTRFCEPAPQLVGTRFWLPPEPFEFGWETAVGCNSMRCDRCRQVVRSEARPDGVRHYRCACQEKDVVWQYRIGDEPDDLYAPFTGWACEGHPDFRLPATLDGVRLDHDTDWGALAGSAIRRPPFVPPGLDGDVVWLIRLHRLLDAEGPRLSRAVAGLLDSDDPVLVRGALDFFLDEDGAAGGERVTAMVVERRAWLSETPDPRYPSDPLLDTAAELLFARLSIAADTGEPADREVLGAAKRLALTGAGPHDAPLALGVADPDWLWAHAGDLVRAHEEWAGMLVYAVADASAEVRRRVVTEAAGIAPDRVRRAVGQHVPEPERGALLAAIDAAAP